MSIRIAYCSFIDAEYPAKHVTAAGHAVATPSSHWHASDGKDHPCTVVTGVSEKVPSKFPSLCSDNTTTVADTNKLLEYLAKYIP